jgi:hypothetical protein
MARHCPIFYAGWAFADRHGIDDPAMDAGLLGVVTRMTHTPGTAQVCKNFSLQGATRLDKERAVDGFVRHLQVLFNGARPFEPSCDLLRCPLMLQFSRHDLCQSWIAGQFAWLGPVRILPGRLVGPRSPVASLAAVTVEFAADGGCSSSQASGNAADRLTMPGKSLLAQQGSVPNETGGAQVAGCRLSQPGCSEWRCGVDQTACRSGAGYRQLSSAPTSEPFASRCRKSAVFASCQHCLRQSAAIVLHRPVEPAI